jgi:simple sugar transport system ATP-binding protein
VGQQPEVAPSTADDGRPASSGPPAVEARGVDKRFGSTVALKDVGIAVEAGSTHALVGRNGAGKSTLVAILTGLESPDAGTVRFSGVPAPALGDREGWRRRVACVYQASTIIPALTAAENLYLNRQAPRAYSLIGWRRLRREAQDLLAEWELDIDARCPAGELTVEQRQMLEIARALSFGARLVILDEPTARLDGAAIARLFGRIRRLQEQGVTFLYISHHLQEIYEICDTVTVLRDARNILTSRVTELAKDDLVRAMTGELERLGRAPARRPARAASAREPVLEVRDLGDDEQYSGVTLSIAAGEVVGLAGNAASGKVAVAERIAGLRRSESGDVRVAGAAPRQGSVPAALANGIALVPRDRHHEGFVPNLSISENVTMTIAGRFVRHGIIDRRRRDAVASDLIDALSIKTPGPTLPVAALSGGNQQKVVMARALAVRPKVLVLITPTLGVDVRSKEVLLDAVEAARAGGAAVLVVSDDLDELRPCDHVLVMFRGRVVRSIARGWQDHELVAAMEGVLDD